MIVVSSLRYWSGFTLADPLPASELTTTFSLASSGIISLMQWRQPSIMGIWSADVLCIMGSTMSTIYPEQLIGIWQAQLHTRHSQWYSCIPYIPTGTKQGAHYIAKVIWVYVTQSKLYTHTHIRAHSIYGHMYVHICMYTYVYTHVQQNILKSVFTTYQSSQCEIWQWSTYKPCLT